MKPGRTYVPISSGRAAGRSARYRSRSSVPEHRDRGTLLRRPYRRPGDAYDDEFAPSRLLEFTRADRPSGTSQSELGRRPATHRGDGEPRTEKTSFGSRRLLSASWLCKQRLLGSSADWLSLWSVPRPDTSPWAMPKSLTRS